MFHQLRNKQMNTAAITTETVQECLISFMIASKGVAMPFSVTHGYVADHFGVDKADKRFMYFVNDQLIALKAKITKK